MAIKFNIKETIKTFILAPAVAGIAFVTTNILVNMSTVSGTLYGSTHYALIVSGLTFALVLIEGMDDIISDIKEVPKV